MPVIIEDKIEMFNKLLFEGINKQSSAERQQIYEEHLKEKEKAQNEADEKIKVISEDAAKRAEREKIRLVSRVKAEQEQRMLEKKRLITDSMVSLLKQKALEFTKTHEYNKYLARNIKDALAVLEGADRICFYFLERDIEVLGGFIEDSLKNLAEDKKYIVERSPVHFIGGFTAKDPENLMQVDYTLDVLIEENRDIIYKAVFNRLNEVEG